MFDPMTDGRTDVTAIAIAAFNTLNALQKKQKYFVFYE